MDRKSAAYNKSRKGLLMAPIPQFWSFKIEDSPSVNGLQKQWYGNALSVRLTVTHSSTSLGPTTRVSNSDISRRIQLPTMIPTSANHIFRFLPRRLKGHVIMLDFLCVCVCKHLFSTHTPHSLGFIRSYYTILRDTPEYTSLVKSGDPTFTKSMGSL
jgi:hypothetical protein